MPHHPPQSRARHGQHAVPRQKNITTPRSHREGTAPASVPTPSTVHQSGSPEGTGPSGRADRGCRRADRSGPPRQAQKSGRRRQAGRARLWRRGSRCTAAHVGTTDSRERSRNHCSVVTPARLAEQCRTPSDAGKPLWFDDPLLHGYHTFLIRRQDNPSWSLPMVQTDVTLNVTPLRHLVNSWQERIVTLELGTSPSIWARRSSSSRGCLGGPHTVSSTPCAIGLWCRP